MFSPGVYVVANAFILLWLQKCVEFGEFLRSSTYVTNCVSAVLLEERGYLNNPMVFRLFSLLVPKVGKQVLKESVTNLILSRANALVASEAARDIHKHARRITADLRAVLLVLSVHGGVAPACLGLANYLRSLEAHCQDSLPPAVEDKDQNRDAQGEPSRDCAELKQKPPMELAFISD